MPYLLGVDEAGYGPNLGPLLIAATVWHVPDHLPTADLYELLSSGVCAQPRGRADDRLWIGDSKAVYKSGDGLAALERGVLAAAAVAKRSCFTDSITCGQLWDALDSAPGEHHWQLPWPVEREALLPLELSRSDWQVARECLQNTLLSAGVTLEALRVAAIFPEPFNTAVAEHGTKGAALSRWSLALFAQLLAELEAGPVLVMCDKHGGRNRYAPLLQEQFPEYLVEIHGEHAQESRYCFGPAERRVEVRFRVGSEAFLPVALASMTAKYLRELSMRAFNRFWQGQIENLRPTAGYPIDAKRFRAEIRPAQLALGIEDRVLWRER